MIRIKRVYEPIAAEDGTRVLVDRLWPRGVAKAKAHIDLWLKDVAPSNELRTRFAHDPAKWEEFQKRYIEELKANDTAVHQLRELAGKGTVTLLFGAHDEAHNQAVVLKEYLSRP